MSLMVALEFLVLFLFSLPHDAVGRGEVELKLIKFEYPDKSIKSFIFSLRPKIGNHIHRLTFKGDNNRYTFGNMFTSGQENPIKYRGAHIKIDFKMDVFSVKNGKKKLIDSVHQQLDITPDNEQRTLMITMTNNSKLSISYRAVCDRHYYGQHCNTHCYPRDDSLGHFYCDSQGRKCRKGWKDPGRNCTIPDVAASSSSSASTCSSFQIVVVVLLVILVIFVISCFILLLLVFRRPAISERFRECCGGQGPEGPTGGTQPSNNDSELIQIAAENGENEQRGVQPEEILLFLSRHSNGTGPQTHLSFRGIDSYVMDKDKKCDESINHGDELGVDLQVRIDEAKCDGVEEAMGAAPVALVARYIGIEDYIEENEAIAVTVVEDGNGGSESLRNVQGNEIGRVNSDADENSDSAQRMGQIEKKEMHPDPLAKRELKKTPDLILLDKELKNVYAVAFVCLLLESSQINLNKVQRSMIASQSVYWRYMWFANDRHNVVTHSRPGVVFAPVNGALLRNRDAFGHSIASKVPSFFSLSGPTSYPGMASVRISDVVRPYSGEGDVVQSIEKLGIVAELREIKDVAKLLPLFLEGSAFAVYREMDPAKKDDLTEMKRVLTDAFFLNPFRAYEQLIRRVWRDEPVDCLE